jgi:hypothetical protein
MIGYDNGRFSFWQFVSRISDDTSIEYLKYKLDPVPTSICDKGGGIVDPVWKEIANREQDREDQVHENKFAGPWYDYEESSQVREEVSGCHFEG